MLEVWQATYNFGYLKFPLAKLIDLEPDDDYGITDTGKCLLRHRFRIRFYDNLDNRHTIHFDGVRQQENVIVNGKKKYDYFSIKKDPDKFTLFLEQEITRSAIEALP